MTTNSPDTANTITKGPLLYTGTHIPSQAGALERAMVSLNRLAHRKSDFHPNRWIIDSGAFTRISAGKSHLPVREYTKYINRWARCGHMEAAVSQDYMCEPFVLSVTGLSIKEHQNLSTRNYLKLLDEDSQTYVMPVVQGFTPAQYARHLEQLSPHLPENTWTGAGSLCKRQGNPPGNISRSHSNPRQTARPENPRLRYQNDSTQANRHLATALLRRLGSMVVCRQASGHPRRQELHQGMPGIDPVREPHKAQTVSSGNVLNTTRQTAEYFTNVRHNVPHTPSSAAPLFDRGAAEHTKGEEAGTMERKTFVIYHQDCPDGFGAAYAAWLKLGNHATYVPAKYGDQPPEMDPDSLVYVLDFSYPRETVTQLCQHHKLTLLDHHKTAGQSLSGLPGCLVDLSKSGAALAWQHFHSRQRMPLLLAYVQDRDLWKWELSNSRAISAYIYSKGYDFSTWHDMYTILESNPQRPVEIGQAIMQVQNYQLEALTTNARIKTIAGYRVPTVYAPILQSEIGERLLQLHPDAPFAGIYYERDDGRKWSLRSRADFDVSELAESMGGGGHPQAAGFTEPPMLQQPQRN